MLTLQEQANVSFDQLLRWATLNGAAFLGIETQFGSFEPGKKPGINLIKEMNEGHLSKKSHIQRLA